MSTAAVTTEARVALVLTHDFNVPPNDGGFYEVVLPEFMEAMFHKGDEVVLRDSGDDPPLTRRGRIRCLVAVVEATEPFAHPGEVA